MYIASDDLIGGRGDHYFMFYTLVGKSNLKASGLLGRIPQPIESI